MEADQEGRVFPLVELDGGVAGRSRDQVKLGQLHVGGDVDPPAAGPSVNNVLVRIAICSAVKNRFENFPGLHFLICLYLQLPIRRGQRCLSIGKSAKFI